LKQIRKSFTYANVMSTISVFLLLGGGAAFAASQLPKNSVGGRQLKNNSVNSRKVKDRSLLARDFRAGQLPRGLRGAAGPLGPPGPQGPPGRAAIGELVYEEGEAFLIEPGEQAGVQVDCEPGYRVVGGGIYSTSEALGQNVNSSYPSKRGSIEFGTEGWAGFVNNATGSQEFARALAICAKVGSVRGL